MVFRDKKFEYKARYLKELSALPEDHCGAKQFIGSRIGVLKRKLNDPLIKGQERQVIMDLIEVYKKIMK
jgi:hypothetical protein